MWEWVPPFDTTRSQRHSHDHTPQLAAMALPDLVAVTPAPDHRHIDTDVYRFARRGLRRDIVIDGQKVSVLKFNNDCRDLVLPFGAQVHVSYGLDSKRLADQGRTDYAARFRMAVRRIGAKDSTELFEDTLDQTTETWRAKTLNLQQFTLERWPFASRPRSRGSPSTHPPKESRSGNNRLSRRTTLTPT